jgi:hypothetical protein
MKIKMIRSAPGANWEGLKVSLFKAGEEYEVDEDVLTTKVANVFVAEHKAEEVVPEVPVVVGQDKLTPPNKQVIKDAPEKKLTIKDMEKLKAGEIRILAKERKIDLSDTKTNTSAKDLAKLVVKRQ